MKAYLHVGTPKTATTTLQGFLGLNRLVLCREHGFIVPTSVGMGNNLYLAVTAYSADHRDELTRLNRIHTDNDLAVFQRRIISDLKKEIDLQRSIAGRNGQVIFSSEYIHLLLRTPEDLHRLKSVLLSIGIDEIEVIIYLRRTSDLADSYYSTSVKMGVTHTTPQSPDQARYNHLCNHQNTLQRFTKVFGKQNIVARVFDKADLNKGSIISDFLQLIGIDNVTGFDIPDNTNISLSEEGVQIQCRLNKIFPRWIGYELNPLLPRIVKRVTTEYTGSPYAMPSELRQQYNLHFEKSDRWVCDSYFPQRDSLFCLPVTTQAHAATRNSSSYDERAKTLATEFLNEIEHTSLQDLWESSQQVPAPYDQSDFEEQRLSFESLVKLSVGVSQYHLGLIDDAMRASDRVMEVNNHHAEALILKAMCLSELDDYEAVDDIYSELLATSPEHLRVQRLYALNAEKQNISGEALARWSRVLSNFPDHPEALLKTGICQFKCHDYRAAVSYFDKLLDIVPKHLSAVYFKSRCLIELGEFDLIEQLVENLIAQAEVTPALYTVYALAAERLHDSSLAIKRWTLAVNRYPEDVDLLFKAGQYRAKLGQSKYAIGYFNRVLTIEPCHQNALKHKWKSLLSLERHDLADRVFLQIESIKRASSTQKR